MSTSPSLGSRSSARALRPPACANADLIAFYAEHRVGAAGQRLDGLADQALEHLTSVVLTILRRSVERRGCSESRRDGAEALEARMQPFRVGSIAAVAWLLDWGPVESLEPNAQH